MSTATPRKRLTPEQRARAKYNDAQRKMGNPGRVPNNSTHAHIRWLHDDMGVTLQRIADISSTSLGCVHVHYKGKANVITRRNRDAILAVKPEHDFRDGKPGAFIDSTITGRKLGSLAAAGFPLKWLAPNVGVAHTNLLLAYQGKRRFVFASTAEAVSEAYVKYECRKPDEYGIPQGSQRVAQYYALRHGHAPPMCWDPDTISDPQAWPEWTGSCGTDYGYQSHRRLNLLPACQPCIDARNARRAELRAARSAA